MKKLVNRPKMLTININPEVRERLKNVSEQTRYSCSAIIEKMIMNTTVKDKVFIYYYLRERR